MTRETKIGLLVGLAFIIVIGILLSDHLQSAAPQTGAYATETRPNVDSSVRAPRSSRPLPPPATELQQNRPVITSQPPVPQPDNRNALAPELSENHVDIGPAWSAGNTNRQPLDLTGRDRVAVPPPSAEVAQNPDRDRIHSIPPVQQDRAPAEDRNRGNDSPRNNLLALNEQNNNRNDRSPEDPAPPPPPAPAPDRGRSVEHVAEPGDTVSKMAFRYLGSRSLANQNLIINANPVLRANPHKIVVGQKYTIPMQPSGNGGRGTNAASSRDSAVGDATPARETPSTPADDAAAFEHLRAILAADHSTGPEIEYTTRPGDTVWGIAVRECNTPSQATVAKILEMNKDVLRGDARNLRPNVKLRLPPKTVPTAARAVTPAPAR